MSRGTTAPPYPLWLGRPTNTRPVGCVLADAEFDSERNHAFCRQQLGASSVIPAKRFTSRRATGVRGQMRENFPRELHGRRSLIENVFSSVKRKFSCRAPGRTLHTQARQALLLSLTFNLYSLWLPAGATPTPRMSTGPTVLMCAVYGARQQWVLVRPGNRIVPPGSNRSGGGGNEAAGAFGVKGRRSDLAGL